MVELAIFCVAVWFVLKLLSMVGKEKCPACGARAATFRHVRKDGKPDLRYKHNPLDCRRCGASS